MFFLCLARFPSESGKILVFLEFYAFLLTNISFKYILKLLANSRRVIMVKHIILWKLKEEFNTAAIKADMKKNGDK